MIALVLVAACAGTADEGAPALPSAANEVTFGTLTSLGSYHLQASVHRTTSGGDQVADSKETLEVRWKDPDHWSYRLGRDGRVRSEVVVWDARAWAGRGDGPLVSKGDAEPYRVQLASVWDPWAWGLEGLADAVAYQPAGVEVIDGRRAERHTLGLVPDAAAKRRGWTPTAVSGEVWIDEALAVRLKGQVLVDAVSGGSTQRVELLFSVSSIGGDPGVSPPQGDKR